jgi:hypothetical protein
MATTSFDRSFVVTDPVSIKQFKQDLDNPTKVKFAKRDLEEDKHKGIASLKRRLSTLTT